MHKKFIINIDLTSYTFQKPNLIIEILYLGFKLFITKSISIFSRTCGGGYGGSLQCKMGTTSAKVCMVGETMGEVEGMELRWQHGMGNRTKENN